MIKQWVKRVVEALPCRDEKTAVITERSSAGELCHLKQERAFTVDEGSSPSVPILPLRQMVRHRVLVPIIAGSNPVGAVPS